MFAFVAQDPAGRRPPVCGLVPLMSVHALSKQTGLRGLARRP